jgi:nucleoside-diphosphate-sugar epimerase
MLNHHNHLSKKPNRVVVIGGSGFLGKCVVAKLISIGIEVLNLSSKDVNLLESSSVGILAKLLKNSDTVIFLSAITPDKCRNIDAFMKNILMIKHFCEVLKNLAVAQLIYFSSDAIYGQNQSFLSEDSPLTPQDLYGSMHLSRELMLKELTDIPLAILRITAAYGADDTHTSYGPNRFLKSALKNKRIDLFGCGEEFRDHIYGDDIADITNLCVHMRSSGVLNVATGTSFTFKRVAELVADRFSEHIEIQQNPRSNPITHRHFNITNLLKAFPSLCLTRLDYGLKITQNKILEN